MSDSLPKAEIEPEPRGRDRLSLTWLVPIGALVIALAVTWQVYSERGPLLEVSLRNASGLATGQTVLRYRDVEIGVVESLRFAEDLSSVIAAIRIEKDMAPYLDEDAKIWAVRPQVSANGVSGLDTVISGVYLAASFDNQADGMLPLIVAERAAPLTPAGEPGRRIRLRGSDGGSISVGAPILFKGVDVGRIESKAISEEGDAVLFDAFIDAPYDRFVTESALFWNASGLALNLGPGGAELNVSSLASLVRGGVAFDTLGVSLRPAEDGQEYRLYPNEEAAQDSLLNVDQGIEVEFSAVFSGTLRGLTVGAPVEYRGVRVGEVLSLSTRLNLTVTPRRPELLTTLVIRPRRFGLDLDTTPAETVAFLNELVAEGLRARLAPTGLLGGTMVVELFETGERGRAVLSNDGRRPRIPSTAPSGGGFAASAEGVLRRVNDLPFEDLVAGAVTFVNSLNRIINDPAVRDAPASATALIEDLRALVARDELQRAPDELLAAITQMRSLVDGIAASDAAGSLDEITGQATALLASLSASVDGVAPALTAATALIEDLRALPLDDATAEAVGVIGGVNELVATLQALAADPDLLATPGAARAFVGDLRTFLNSDGVQGAPDTLRQTLDQTTALLNALETSGAVDNLTATLESASRAADAAADGVPLLIEDLNTLSSRLAALPIDPLIERANGVLLGAEAFLASPGIRDAPEALRGSLEALTRVLNSVEREGVVAELGSTLNSAGSAANALAIASNDLPRLVEEIAGLAEQAERTLATYGEGSPVNYEAVTAIRDIRDTARAVTALARSIERNPTAWLRGR